jgi:lectin, mannose-binding 1
LGLTAASADQPDSFEVKSFIVRFPGSEGYKTPPHGGDWRDTKPAGHSYDSNHADGGYDEYKDKGWYWADEKDHIKDQDGSKIKTEKERFEDLHARVTLLNHQLDMIFHDLSVFKEQQQDQHKELLQWLAPIHDYTSSSKRILEGVELALNTIEKDVQIEEFKRHLEEIRALIGESHMSLAQHLPASLHGGKFTILTIEFEQCTNIDDSYSSHVSTIRILRLSHHRGSDHHVW